MTTKTFTHTNTSNQYQVIGDHSEIILQGTKAECYRKYNSIDIESSKWGGVEVISPGETTSGNMDMWDGQPVNSVNLDMTSLIHPDYR